MSEVVENKTFKGEAEKLLPFLTGAEFYDCIFESCDFSEQPMQNLKFIDCSFKKSNLSNVSVTNSVFSDCLFEESKLLGINWCVARPLRDVNFKECHMNFTVFQELDMRKTSFKGSVIREADFAGAKLQQADFSDCDLSGSIFNNANLSKAKLLGAEGYYIDPKNTIVKGCIVEMPEAMSLLKALEIDVR